MSGQKVVLVGCGILRREIESLIEKNSWPLETCFLKSALHCELDNLAHSLKCSLQASRDRDVIVFYGCCHPLMEHMLNQAGTIQTEGQNCISMLLGRERFAADLAEGAFFLLEEWAHKWDAIIKKAFGTQDVQLIREIFQTDRKYLLAVRTPCSSDFRAAAQAAAAMVDLPLRWIDVNLAHLEVVLASALSKKMQSLSWTT